MKRQMLFLLFVLCLVSAACVQRNGVVRQSEFTVLRNGALAMPLQEEVGGTAYVSTKDGSSRIAALSVQVERCLADRGYAVTHNPSEAGYIIQLSVPAVGPSSLDAAQNAVNNGYDGEARLSGTGGTALVADTLVVQRRVPQSAKKKLKTISNRMAVADKQMRLALFAPRTLNLQQVFPDVVSEKVAGEICSGLGKNAPVSR